MSGLRFVAIVALALWIGGLAVLGLVVAPVLFDVLQSHDPEAGRTIAGLAFGAVLESFCRWSLFFGAVIAAIYGWRAARGRGGRGLAWRTGALAIMLGAATVTGSVIGPRIDAIRAGTPTAIADLPDADPVKVAFGRLHGLAGGLMLLTVAGGLALLYSETHAS
jgi:hypothetical protein